MRKRSMSQHLGQGGGHLPNPPSNPHKAHEGRVKSTSGEKATGRGMGDRLGYGKGSGSSGGSRGGMSY